MTESCDSSSILAAKLDAAERQIEQQERTGRETHYWFYLAESQVQQLADGIVTQELKLMFGYALDTIGELERNAAKPLRKRKAG